MITYHFGRSGSLIGILGFVLCSGSALADEQAQGVDSATQGQAQEERGINEIVVTARKRSESLTKVPVSVTALSGDTLADFNVQRFADYASMVPNMDFSVGGTGGVGLQESRSVDIRGMSGEGTTSMYLDDTPLPSFLDPTVTDIERLEVLRGPQGTLFGTSSLGGNVRYITRRPSLTANELKFMAEGSWSKEGTEVGYGGDVVANWVVKPGVFAIRMMIAGNSEPGYVTRTFPCTPGSIQRCSSKGEGGNDTYGGSLSALWQATERFSVNAKLLAQSNRYLKGFPVVLDQPPDYKVDTLTINRAANGLDREWNNWYVPALTLRYEGNGWNVVSSTSYYDPSYELKEDNTEGTAAALQELFGFTPGPQALLVPATTRRRQFYEEARLAFDPIHNVSGILGVFYNRGHGVANTFVDVPGLGAAIGQEDDLLYNFTSDSHNTEKSVFGELYYKFLDKWTLTAGARSYELSRHGVVIGTGTFGGPPTSTRSSETGVSPKAALQYDISSNSMVYASMAKGYRPGGGGNPPPTNCAEDLAELGLTFADASHFDSDDVRSYELGGKASLSSGKIVLTGAVFNIDWSDIQQQINLAGCGAAFKGNAGAARNRGGELELSGYFTDALSVRAGVGYVDAKITEAAPTSPQRVGDPVFNVPKITANIGAIYSMPVSWRAGTRWILTTNASYVDKKLSNNTSGSFPITRPAYFTLNAGTGLRWDNQELSLYARNLTNEKANLGDLQPLAFGQNATIDGVSLPIGRIRVLAPFQIGIQYRRGF